MPDTHCLIVDDSRMSRMLIHKIIIDAHPDWLIEEAGNGDEAIDKSNDNSFDVITLDYNMPGMNGLEVAQELRPKFPDAKIVLLTANIQESIRNKATAMAVDFIAKPITEDKIKSYVG